MITTVTAWPPIGERHFSGPPAAGHSCRYLRTDRRHQRLVAEQEEQESASVAASHQQRPEARERDARQPHEQVREIEEGAATAPGG
jgi:hypothetical protein